MVTITRQRKLANDYDDSIMRWRRERSPRALQCMRTAQHHYWASAGTEKDTPRTGRELAERVTQQGS